MTYEKAELILEQLMFGDRTLYLVLNNPAITDCPTEGQEVIAAITPENESDYASRAGEEICAPRS